MNRRQAISLLALSTPAIAQERKRSLSNHWSFLGGEQGPWKVTRMSAYRGEGLDPVERLDVLNGNEANAAGKWRLRGFTSNVRYATQGEVQTLKAQQEGLGRPQATCGALIPIKKSARWWELAQDERRAIFEETSKHTAIGLEYLPEIARRLHHSRDLGEPFDFLTWFEFAPEHTAQFDKLVARLRETKEWEFVEREVDIRLTRAAAGG